MTVNDVPGLPLEQAEKIAANQESYPSPDPDLTCRWYVVGAGDGLIWTDDDKSAGVAWVRLTPTVAAMWAHFQLAKAAGVTATVAYELARRKLPGGNDKKGSLNQFYKWYANLMTLPAK